MAEPKIQAKTLKTVENAKFELQSIEQAIDAGDWDVMSDHIFKLHLISTALFKQTQEQV